MIPGGIYDKLGNRYEAKWVVRCLLDIFMGHADWLKFEGITTEYEGFEFAISRGKKIEWHQTKSNSPEGNWTINALAKQGVLRAFSNRLAADRNAHCYFVSQDGAKQFRTLIEKASIANSSTEFVALLSPGQNDSFRQLRKEWAQSDDVTFEWLRRSNVRVMPEQELESFIESYGDFCFLGGAENVFPFLRDVVENNFNRTLTLEDVLGAIKAKGVLIFKEWAFLPAIQKRLTEETDAYLETYPRFGFGGTVIQRSQTATLVQEIARQDGPELLLLTGQAGSGKSGVVRGAIEHFRANKIPHLAFRVDHYLTCSTKDELGERLTGRKESPVSTLKGTYPTTDSILIIDQVDAVSEVSGREGQVKEVVFRLIKDAQNIGGVKIIIVSRTFDLENEPRLKALRENNRSTQIEVPLLDWKGDVEPMLKSKGFNVSSFSQPQKELLLLPINLSVFLEINDRDFSFKSRSNLHERLIQKKQQEWTRDRKTTWPLIEPLTAMCDWMSQRQELKAPIYVLDKYPGAAQVLSSEGLIVSSRGHVNFFHDSFFDHVYSRGFLQSHQSVLELLTSTEQYLFRRTQVRQILDALRQHDPNRYHTELSLLLFDDHIRFHIKVAVCQWLNSIENPAEREYEIVSKLDTAETKFSQLFRVALLSTDTWFDLLNEKGWIGQQIGSPYQERARIVLWWLSGVAGERPKEVASLLRSWWGGDVKQADQLTEWFGFVRRSKPDDELLQLCEDVIKANPGPLLKEKGRDRVMMLLDTWGQKFADRAGGILRVIFDAWFALNPGHTPFERMDIDTIDDHSLAQIAEKAPRAFLIGTTDALLKSIDLVAAQGEKGQSWYELTYRTYSGARYGFDRFLGLFRSALANIAKESPGQASDFLARLDPRKHISLMHLHLETIQANPAFFGNRLVDLVSDKTAFEAGWHGAQWLSLAHACRTSFPHLSDVHRCFIEEKILEYNPEIEWAIRISRRVGRGSKEEIASTRDDVIHELNRSGYEQLCVLETIGEEQLGLDARARLCQLRRKFPQTKIEEPWNSEAHFVGPPIKRQGCEKMKDRDWLSAIERYNTEGFRRYGPDFTDGGAEELARELQESAKKDPGRFSDLSKRIPETAHIAYVAHILNGVAESESPSDEAVIQVVGRAHNHPGRPFGIEICRLLERHPHVARDPSILEVVIWYALNGEAETNMTADLRDTERETTTIDSLVQRGGLFYLRGINGARGEAWQALGRILWQVPEAAKVVWEALDQGLSSEPLVSVRCCMMTPLTPLFNDDKEHFAAAIQKLIMLPNDTPLGRDAVRLSPLVTPAGIHLFPYIYRWLPDLASELTEELLESGDNTKHMIGSWLIFCESFVNNDYIDKADTLTAVSLDHRRLMASVASDAMKWAQDRRRVEALLRTFFFDEDKQVREQVARAFSNVEPGEIESYKELTAAFLKSPAFVDHGFGVLDMLENATCDVLDLVVEATRMLVYDIVEKGDQFGRRGTDAHQLKEILKKEYPLTETKPEARRKILDMIDLMLENEIYGVDDILKAHDRW